MAANNISKPHTKAEKVFRALSICFAFAVCITSSLYLLDIITERSISGFLIAAMMICQGASFFKQKRSLAILMWIVSLFVLYTAVESFLFDHFNIFIGTWRS